MNDGLTYSCLTIFLSAICAFGGIWSLMQILMYLLCWDIKRILQVRSMSAFDYLHNARFWKSKSGKYYWWLKGPGMFKLAKKVLLMARQEVRESNLRSNSIVFRWCSNCIFLNHCNQKFFIRCIHCTSYKQCPKLSSYKCKSVCNQFCCAKWIEKD